MSHTSLTIICTLLLLPSLAFAQVSTEQPAQTDAPITITFTSIKPIKSGLIVTVSYVNHLPEAIQFTLMSPEKKGEKPSGFAADNLGNYYTLVGATGMTRQDIDPNLDLSRPDLPEKHSLFLLAPPNKKVSAIFVFWGADKEKSSDSNTKPTSFTLSIGHYARPVDKFDPKQPRGAFGFAATITNAKPD